MRCNYTGISVRYYSKWDIGVNFELYYKLNNKIQQNGSCIH